MPKDALGVARALVDGVTVGDAEGDAQANINVGALGVNARVEARGDIVGASGRAGYTSWGLPNGDAALRLGPVGAEAGINEAGVPQFNVEVPGVSDLARRFNNLVGQIPGVGDVLQGTVETFNLLDGGNIRGRTTATPQPEAEGIPAEQQEHPLGGDDTDTAQAVELAARFGDGTSDMVSPAATPTPPPTPEGPPPEHLPSTSAPAP